MLSLFYQIQLLGSERALYFLHPPAMEQPVNPRVQHLLVVGLGMGAKEVWRALHEEPKCQREIAAAKKGPSLSQQVRDWNILGWQDKKVPWLGRPATMHRLQQVTEWRQQLHAMHQLGKQRQRTASHLLAAKHLTDLSDNYGTEGPTRYFHCTLKQ
ncbi:uncharacterized protein LOC133380808 isoform X2 [Rhineura floridana]|uniref:uncharacterized protein LOC133380808 isoform X2 n=1 Tax=Rhineura floridana TaxID=261503 RepID=UPI002AC7EDF5|nr:uncharacterized protein LOC133380808 isoform X2 [Rhineura floridana]